MSDIAELTRKLFADPSILDDLSSEDIARAKSHLSPAGDIKGVKESFANISIMNLSEKYQKRLLLTSLVGFTYRLLEEYEASEAEKNTIKKFLDRNFDFDPDRHVRVAHTDPATDPERKSRAELIRARTATKGVEEKLRGKQDQIFSYLKSTLMSAKTHADSSIDAVNGALVALTGGFSADDYTVMLAKSRAQLAAISSDLAKVTGPLSAAETLAALKPQPPADTFHNFTRYYENNYESLREITTSLYAEKPDIEFGIIYYDSFKSEGMAKDYLDQHSGEFKVEPVTVSNRALTLLGPWKKNRDRIAYYDKNKEVLKALVDQQEMDAKLGADMMKKVVSKAKKKNVEEVGPDAPGLATYTKSMQIVKELAGADRVLSEEEKKKFAEAKKAAQDAKESLEVPDDAIQVDVFKPSPDGKALNRHIMYTAAEKPLHLQPDDPFAGQYQPVRAEGQTLDDAYDVMRDPSTGQYRHTVAANSTSSSSSSSGL